MILFISFRMNKIKNVIISFFCLIFCITVDAVELSDIKIDLYSIERGEKLSYMVGSIHYMPLGLIKKEIREILTSQEYLVLEHRPLSNNSNYFCENNESWWYQLSVKEQDMLSVLSIENIKNCKLEYIFYSLVQWCAGEAISIKTNRLNIIVGMETDLENLYVREKVYYLETDDEIYEIILKSKIYSNVSDFKNIFFLAAELLGSEKEQIAENLVDAIFNNEDDNEDKESDEILLDERNLLWINRIENYHNNLDGKVLFIFGAGHLNGYQGIIKLLEDRAFKVTKLIFDSIDSDKTDL